MTVRALLLALPLLALACSGDEPAPPATPPPVAKPPKAPKAAVDTAAPAAPNGAPVLKGAQLLPVDANAFQDVRA